MSSTFSFSRLGKLITKQFFENSRLYLFSVLAMFGLLALCFSFWIAVGGRTYEESATFGIFLTGLFIAGLIFASMSFSILGNKDKGVYWLGVPATHFEKLVCTILYSTVVFTLVYCICFWLVKWLAIAFLNGYMAKHPELTYTPLTDFEHGFGRAIRYFVCAYFAVQALFMLGSVYFARYSFVITAVITAALIFAFGYYINTLKQGMLGPVSWDILSARQFDAATPNGYKLYSVSPAIARVLFYFVQFAWAPVFWLVTWYRLKEKQL